MSPTMLALLASGMLRCGFATPPNANTGAMARIVDDSAHRRMVITIGPATLPAHSSHHDIRQFGLQAVALPSGGWLRGYLVELVDSAGDTLTRDLIHHVEMIELERRALLDSGYQRMVSVGKETPAEMLPAGIGYPVRRGERVGINAMLDNPTGRTYAGVFVRVTLPYLPADTQPPPLEIYTISTDVKGVVGAPSDFDVPPGPSERSHVFTVPIAGWLVAVGGHLHDFGRRIRLVSLLSKDTIYDARSELDARGHIVSLPMGELWHHGGYHVEAGERFELTAWYDNTSGRTIPDGGMGTLGGVFKPDSGQAWPALDPNAPAVRSDLAYLESLGRAMSDMGGMKMPEE